MSSSDYLAQAFDALLKNGKTICTAESCTGGLIASSFTSLTGSSKVFERGYITYSNAAKNECLDVPNEVIERCGAVSKQVATEMALGALKNSHADISISVTGIAGPDGGSVEKPVGLVYIGWATSQESGSIQCNFPNETRKNIQNLTKNKALKMITILANGKSINDKF